MAAESNEDWTRIIRFMEEEIPFNVFLGLKVAQLSSGRAVTRLPWRDVFIGDPYRKILHGGVTSTLMDVTGGAAGFTLVNLPDDRLSTVDIRVDYLQPVPRSDLYCEAVVERMGNRVASTPMSLYAENPDTCPEGATLTPLATGRGVYSVRRAFSDERPDKS